MKWDKMTRRNKEALLAGALLVAFGIGLNVGPVVREWYVGYMQNKFVEWKFDDALAKYTDEAEISYAFYNEDANGVLVLIYPELTPEVERILRRHFCNLWVEYRGYEWNLH